jgi:hypothetical protein
MEGILFIYMIIGLSGLILASVQALIHRVGIKPSDAVVIVLAWPFHLIMTAIILAYAIFHVFKEEKMSQLKKKQ